MRSVLDPEQLSQKIVSSVKEKDTHTGLIYNYKRVGQHIIRTNSLTGKNTFYNADGSDAFSRQG